MTVLRPFRWQPHDGRRHAVTHDAVPLQATTTLCGEELTIPATPLGNREWCWPTCTDCDTAWRHHEGIPLFPRQRTPHHRQPKEEPRQTTHT
ncbi:zinc finger protein [Saccharothrix lopnurensis]|uniref:Zinc finger protein n=1 Tax=Saccharothrix lopnurensis TaxID=1670621 RepID=A0ABW1P7H6_9PSEU